MSIMGVGMTEHRHSSYAIDQIRRDRQMADRLVKMRNMEDWLVRYAMAYISADAPEVFDKAMAEAERLNSAVTAINAGKGINGTPD